MTPIIIGLTGGIGAGKSFIAEKLRQTGYPVYDSDHEAQRLIHDNSHVRNQIEMLFGNDIFIENRYDKRRVASLVFHAPELLDKLNNIVHPAVASDFSRWADTQNSPIVFIESAILFESGFDKLCNAVVCISAPEEIRIGRVMQRDNLTREQILSRIHNQAAEDTIEKRADLLICNNGTQEIEALCLQIQKFCSTFVD